MHIELRTFVFALSNSGIWIVAQTRASVGFKNIVVSGKQERCIFFLVWVRAHVRRHTNIRFIDLPLIRSAQYSLCLCVLVLVLCFFGSVPAQDAVESSAAYQVSFILVMRDDTKSKEEVKSDIAAALSQDSGKITLVDWEPQVFYASDHPADASA